jgi:ribosomal protein S18 acetylase RimI-like enzyme
MPLPLPELPMLIDEFHVMEHRLGWKHEYWDGAARLSCQPTAVASLELDLALPKDIPLTHVPGYQLCGLTVADETALVDLFLRAFDDAVEYAGWDEAQFERDAQRSIKSFFDRRPSSNRCEGLLNHSFAVRHQESIVAAILIRKKKGRPTMEPIMVSPGHQRRGLGSALLATAIQSLQQSGVDVLGSRCHLGNIASLNWHKRNGFREIPNFFAASHRAMHFQWLAEHHSSRNQPQQAAEMLRQAEHWERIAEEEQSALAYRPPNNE